MKQQLLFVEDEIALAGIVHESLTTRGFHVVHCTHAATAFKQYEQQRPDVLILDVMLPDGDGFALARQIRARDMDLPIIFLSARSLPTDVVTGFESGGNDYLKKPFSMEELIVRIKVLLSKNKTLLLTEITNPVTPIGQYEFNYTVGTLHHPRHHTTLTGKETELLKLLVLNKNRIIQRKALLLQVWGNDDFFTGRSLDVFITKLRKHLEADPSVKIANIRGVGYKLIG